MLFKKLRYNLTDPKFAFVHAKEKIYKTILYILLLTVIISIPITLKATIDPTSMGPGSREVYTNLQGVIDKDIEIVDSKLKYEEEYVIDLGLYNIMIGKKVVNKSAIVINFGETHIETYIGMGGGQKFTTNLKSYEELGLVNFKFNLENKNALTNIIVLTLAKDNKLKTVLVLSEFFLNLFELVFVILMLTFLAFISKALPIKFMDHFRVNTQIATIYAVTTLIVLLFGGSMMNILPIVFAYFYQVRAYRSVKIITKIKVKNKDE